ncbi:ACT domain-containing protein [Amphritea balenae]|uniref:Glycine cleavage system transcriptional repressor n=1 Tax=Amphritea balenae TaxID=452629 RepID=A0A3P1SW96_9GAMM|nr:ACT domain-containing protein [Amphritea balenae]RRD01482.1 hypothetical protein EHS89_02665 [Amphritea balenae]GGK56727.1 hypothetical protein GCM10007941_03600 [Amphritea balenae]
MATWLLTVTGNDQPEQLKKFCETIALMEGVFLDSQQTVMAGRVMALYKVCLPDTHIPFAQKMFAEFALKGVEVIAIDELDERSEYKRSEYKCAEQSDSYLVLDLKGQYRFGIDHDIRMILECHGAETEQLNQQYLGRSLVGEQQFSARIRARMSRLLSEPDLLQALHRLSPGLSIRLSVIEPTNALAC